MVLLSLDVSLSFNINANFELAAWLFEDNSFTLEFSFVLWCYFDFTVLKTRELSQLKNEINQQIKGDYNVIYITLNVFFLT